MHVFGEFKTKTCHWFVETPRLIYCRDSFQKPVYPDLPNLQPGIFYFFQDGSPPLHSAVSGDQQEMVELLVEKYKADPTMPATLVCLLLMFSYILNKPRTEARKQWK